MLDVAAGTGTSSAVVHGQPARPASPATSPSACCAQGARQRGGADVAGVRFVAGDALALPFADATFDAVTISFGLRNVHDVGAALRELLRVTRPGGRLVICEFSTPTWTPFRRLYVGYLARAAGGRQAGQLQPRLLRLPGRVDPGAGPPQRDLAATMAAPGGPGSAGATSTGGIVALHRGGRP